MKNLTIKNIIKYTNGIPYNCEKILEKEVTDVSIDSRKIKKGGLFIAIKGAKVDGYDFIEDVMNNGALLAISEKEINGATFSYIKVESSNLALQDIARLYREGLNARIIGITGSVGKTSTKEMVAAILSEEFNVVKTIGNFNNEIGVPLTLFSIKEDTQVAVVEMGINHFGEMTRLAKMVRPDICIITNIGDCHLEFLGDRNGVYKAKSEMFAYRHFEDSSIIFNGDDIILNSKENYNDTTIYKFYNKKPKNITSDEFCAYASDVVNHGLNGTSCKLHIDGETAEIKINVPGNHMVSNMLAGAMCGKLLGMSLEEIKSGALKAKPIEGRGRIIKNNGIIVFDGCYNANPASMKSSLKVLEMTKNRKVAVLGDMGELGKDESKLHFELGKYIRNINIDVLVGIGNLSKNTINGFYNDKEKEVFNGFNDSINNIDIYYFDSINNFLKASNKIITKGDAVLVKASHFMQFSNIVEFLSKPSN